MRRHGRKAVTTRGAGVAFCLTLVFIAPALAQGAVPVGERALTAADIVLLAGFLGAVGFAVLSAIALIRARNRAETENTRLRLEVGSLRTLAERAEALVNEEDQRLIAWGGPDDLPLVAGQLHAAAHVPADPDAFLDFSTWLTPESSAHLVQLIARLRERGEAFSEVATTVGGRLLDVRGRTVGGSAVVRFRDLTGDRLARAEIEAQHEQLVAEVETMQAMLASAPMPIWLRDERGTLVWVNGAYAAAVEANDPEEVVSHGLELLDTNGRQMIAATHAHEPVFARRLAAIVGGARRMFDVADIASKAGSGGIAIDVSEADAAQAALRREIDFNARTLDQLQTAVAVFGADKRLKSYNEAYRRLFGLDEAFLESSPEEGAILDRLRGARKLPEQADFRSWRADLLSAYRATEARQHWWHLPDGQTLRVIANPHPQGGMTWVYENVTEQLDLESRYNALVSVQGETLDHLAEGVAVFGSDGRLRLHNPSFGQIWSIDDSLLASRPHVNDIVAACRRPHDDDEMWHRFTACVAGLDESRSSISGRMERQDGRVIDYATVPLPDGQTMVTFVDVTDSVQVERALVERAEALEAADALKNAFIHHVSYELRSPLTNIMGFAQLLTDTRVGPLNPKQHEYTGYIISSSADLLAIVNDILDLTTIDAGIMELDLQEIDVSETIAASIERVQERIDETGVEVTTEIAPGAGRMVADSARMRQVLFNLLSNAMAFSEAGGAVHVSATRDGDWIELAITDEGPGIPEDFIGTAFDRFTSRSRGAARGGVGLGLSIVKSLVGLHGGTVEIASQEGKGATVIVRLPVQPAVAVAAAE